MHNVIFNFNTRQASTVPVFLQATSSHRGHHWTLLSVRITNLKACALFIWIHYLAHPEIWNHAVMIRIKKHTDQLSQRNCTAGWVSFGWVVGDGMGQTILCTVCTKRCLCQKTKSIDLYTINPLLYEKWSVCIFEPSFGGLGATYAVHLGLIRKRIVDFPEWYLNSGNQW